MTWKRLVLLDGALLGLAILASRAALLLHEVVGHGLTAMSLGAQGFTMKLSLLGGGYVTPLGLRGSGAGYAYYSLGGIALNLLTGGAAWILARRLRGRGLFHAFLLMFGAGSIGQALFYLATGFYYGEGDPQGFVGPGGDLSPYRWAWLLFPLPFAGAAAFSARVWLDFLAGHAAVDTPFRRFTSVAATVGIVTAAYMGLWFATWDARVDVTMKRQAERTVAAKLQQEKLQEARKHPPPPPPPPPAPHAPPAAPPAPPPPPVVTAEEVAARMPAPIAGITMLVAGLLAAGITVLRRRPPPAEPMTLTPLAAAIPMILAAATLGAIAMLGK